jgi:hypothetical protein
VKPLFSNAAGIFDVNKFKEYFKAIRASSILKDRKMQT